MDYQFTYTEIAEIVAQAQRLHGIILAEPMADHAPAHVIHRLEQLGAQLNELAPVLHGYFEALERAGFSEEAALELTIAMQESMVEMTLPEPDA